MASSPQQLADWLEDYFGPNPSSVVCEPKQRQKQQWLFLGERLHEFINAALRLDDRYECDKCHASKGEHALGESCSNNCGGHVVRAKAPPPASDPEALERVAKALQADGLVRKMNVGPSWPELDEPVKDAWRDYAQTAILALLNTTDDGEAADRG